MDTDKHGFKTGPYPRLSVVLLLLIPVMENPIYAIQWLRKIL